METYPNTFPPSERIWSLPFQGPGSFELVDNPLAMCIGATTGSDEGTVGFLPIAAETYGGRLKESSTSGAVPDALRKRPPMISSRLLEGQE